MQATEALKEEQKNARVSADEIRKKLEQMGKKIEEAQSKKQELQEKQVEIIQQRAETVKKRFVIRPDGTVVDNVTKLMWLRNANYAMWGMNWDTAMKYCEGLNYAGHNDWKLPSNEELKTLVGNKG